MKPSIIIGADHAGFALKERLVHELCRRKFVVEDTTPEFKEGDDYPPIGQRVAKEVNKYKNSVGILICKSGVGMAISANRIKGARAMVGHDGHEIKLARIDDDINILCISGWKTSTPMAMGMIKIFLNTKTSKSARHVRRVKQLG
jgi:ribose 5-phosphate isomerase B